MTLSEKEVAELAVVELHADLALAEIQKRTNQRGHTIRYNLKRLEDAGIISKAPFIDVYPLGYTGHAIFFSIAPSSSSSKEAFIESLKNHQNVQWLAELGGDYQYVATLFVHHPSEVQDFFDAINQKFGNILFEKTISTRLSFTQFNRKYFGGKPDSLSFGSTTPQTINETDAKILSSMANNTKLYISQTTLRFRKKRLKEKHLLLGEFYQINAAEIGMQTHEVFLSAKGASQSLRESLFTFSKKHKYIVHFVSCLGEWDYEIGIEVPDNQTLLATLQEIAEKFGDQLVSMKTLSLFQNLKYSLFPFDS